MTGPTYAAIMFAGVGVVCFVLYLRETTLLHRDCRRLILIYLQTGPSIGMIEHELLTTGKGLLRKSEIRQQLEHLLKSGLIEGTCPCCGLRASRQIARCTMSSLSRFTITRAGLTYFDATTPVVLPRKP